MLKQVGLLFLVMTACSSGVYKPDNTESSGRIHLSDAVINTPLNSHLPLACHKPTEPTQLTLHDQETSSISSKENSVKPVEYGAFWWSIQKTLYSISSVLRNKSKQKELLKIIDRVNIQRLYTYAQPFLRSAQAKALRRWHKTLHHAHIESYLLLGSPVWACDASELFRILQSSLNHFQRASKPLERFDGIYLDIEPHTLRSQDKRCQYQWDTLATSEKRSLMYNLLSIIIKSQQVIHQHPDIYQSATGQPLKLAVYLPVWIDNLHTADHIWETALQRDEYYACLKKFTDEVTVASYCRKGLQRINESLKTEKRLLGKQLRVGFNVYHLQGTDAVCKTWQNFDELRSVSKQLHEMSAPSVNIDLENLSKMIEQVQEKAQ